MMNGLQIPCGGHTSGYAVYRKFDGTTIIAGTEEWTRYAETGAILKQVLKAAGWSFDFQTRHFTKKGHPVMSLHFVGVVIKRGEYSEDEYIDLLKFDPAIYTAA